MNIHSKKIIKSFKNYYNILIVITINCLVFSRPNHFLRPINFNNTFKLKPQMCEMVWEKITEIYLKDFYWVMVRFNGNQTASIITTIIVQNTRTHCTTEQ